MKDSVQGDNQQATIEELCWLAGLVDAEGHIGTPKQQGVHRPIYKFRMNITNGNDAIIAEAARIMDKLEATPAIRECKKVYKIVDLSSPVKIGRVLKAIEPYLADKQVLARKMVAFCENRDPNLAEAIINKRYFVPEEAYGLTGKAALSWTAGFADGDGSIGIYKCKSPKGGHSYRAQFSAYNNSKVNIGRVKDALMEHDISFSEFKNTYNGRNAVGVTITGSDQMFNWMNLLRPYLVGKAPQADLALRFLRNRHKRRVPEREEDYLESRALNAPIGASLTTREAPATAA